MTTLFIITLYLSGVFGGYYYTKSRLTSPEFEGHFETWIKEDIKKCLILSLFSWLSLLITEIAIRQVNRSKIT